MIVQGTGFLPWSKCPVMTLLDGISTSFDSVVQNAKCAQGSADNPGTSFASVLLVRWETAVGQ